MASVTPARRAAFQILMSVDRGRAHSDELLRGHRITALSAADRNLVTALVLGVLRWQILFDHRIQAFLERPNAKLDPEVRIALRLGAFQLLHMDRIPARAAIDESVELAKSAGHRFAARMVNAVLRKLSTSAPADTSADTPADLALACAHPRWLVERWVSFYGMEAASTICHHGQSQPEPVIRVADAAEESELTASGIVLQPGRLLTAARVVLTGDVTGTAAYREGRIRLQDEGSQLVAEIAALPLAPHQKAKGILDACAAPGGKTLILAERNPEAHIVACDASAERLAQLRTRLAVLGDRIEFRLGDAAELPAENTFDTVLADVPCSGTGTLGRNPEIRHRLRPDDLARQAERQRAILRAALRAVRPGGCVVYSTCSLEPEENEQVVAAVLASTPNARLIPMPDRILELAQSGVLTAACAERLQTCFTLEGCLRLLPGSFGTDGFFVAMLEKSAG